MHIFLTGVTGYIGGSVAVRLIAEGHQVSGLVRSDAGAEQVAAFGMTPVHGSLDDLAILRGAASAADAVINAASADHEDAAMTLLDAVEGTGKPFIHTSGSSIVGTQCGGVAIDDVFEESTPFTPSPGRAARAGLNDKLLARSGPQTRVIVVAPSLIYGLGHGPGAHSMQIPWLLQTAQKHGVAKHFGPGTNLWSNVHLDDLVELYLLVLARAPAGAFYYAENGEHSMRQLCEAIGQMLGHASAPVAMNLAEAADEWGEGPAMNTMGSNSRVRAVRARSELGWSPQAWSALDEITRGCYAS